MQKILQLIEDNPKIFGSILLIIGSLLGYNTKDLDISKYIPQSNTSYVKDIDELKKDVSVLKENNKLIQDILEELTNKE